MDTNMQPSGNLPGSWAMIQQAWRLYRQRLDVLIGFAAIPGLIGLVGGGAGLYLKAHPDVLGMTSGIIYVIVMIILVLVYWYVSLWAQAAQLKAIAADVPLNLQQGLAQAKPYIMALLLVSVMNFIAGLVGLLFLIIPAILFAIWFSMINYMVVFEGMRGKAAFIASYRLVIGRSWPVLWRYVCFGLCYGALALLINIVSSIISATLPGNDSVIALFLGTVATIFLAPFVLAFGYQLYIHLKATQPASAEMK